MPDRPTRTEIERSLAEAARDYKTARERAKDAQRLADEAGNARSQAFTALRGVYMAWQEITGIKRDPPLVIDEWIVTFDDNDFRFNALSRIS
jgi:hypothetical protein